MMKIGIVILNYNDVKTTLSLVEKIVSFKSIDTIVVVDNFSTDNSVEELENYQNLHNFVLINAPKNGGYSYGNNLGLKFLIEKKNVDIAIIANPDVIFEENVLEITSKQLYDNPSIGVVSPLMLTPHGTQARMWLKSPNYFNSILDCSFIGRQINKLIRHQSVDINKLRQKVDILPGSFLVFKVNALKDIGYLDENVFLFYEENIIGEKLKNAGYSSYLLTNCSYIHNHSVTIKKNLSILNTFKHNLRSKLYFEKTYHKIGSTRELLLKLCMKYAIIEMHFLLKLKSILIR